MRTWLKRSLAVFFLLFVVGLLGFGVVGWTTWRQLPSPEALRRHAQELGRYAALMTDRFGHSMGPLYHDDDQSLFIGYDDLPEGYVNLLVAVEDRSFWHNPICVDPRGVLRGLRGVGGGSTLCQQVFRLVYAKPAGRDYKRKWVEIWYAAKVSLSGALTKQEIVELYTNLSRFGAANDRKGLQAASLHFFEKDARALTRPEQLMLITFLSLRPGSVSMNAERIYTRYRRHVDRLTEAGYLHPSDPDYTDLLAGPVLRRKWSAPTSYGVFLDRVYDEARVLLQTSPVLPDRAGLQIETTLDVALSERLADSLAVILDGYPGAQACFILIDAEGEVRSYLSNRRNLPGYYDCLARETTMWGSQAKVLVYAVTAETWLAENPALTVSDLLERRLPTRYEGNGYATGSGTPKATINLRTAIARSSNGAAAYAGNVIAGLDAVARTGTLFGMDLNPAGQSLPLGPHGVSPLQVAHLYATLLTRRGVATPPVFVRAITSQDSTLLYHLDQYRTEREVRVFSRKTYRVIQQALRETVEYGTARHLSTLPALQRCDVQAKTGTSERNLHVSVSGSINSQFTFSLTLYKAKYTGSSWGSSTKVAVPAAGRLLSAIADHYGL